MSELIAFIYDNEHGAKSFEGDLIAAQKDRGLNVGDAAVILRRDDGRPMLSHAVELVGRGSMGGMFWGFILALVFWARWWGLSVGGALGDLGLEDDFVKDVGDSVGKGHSALLALVDDEMVATVLSVAESSNPRVMRTTFSTRDEQVLQTVFQTTRE
ncbi:MAG: DUF1269 domain-containing protein [Chloroflexota bacterium]|nr:MAG: DUF1269 domain-containing protein [Chloroflexota bacterium]